MNENTIVNNAAQYNFNDVITNFQELPTLSLMREIATIVPMKLPSGKIINIKKQTGSNAYEAVESVLQVNTDTSNPLQTGLSTEAIKDISIQYGDTGQNYASKLLKSIVESNEDYTLLNYLDNNSLSTPVLTLSDKGSSETSLFEITQRVQELVMKMNTPNFRTYDAFVILPYKAAASISALNAYIGGSEYVTSRSKRLIVGRVGKTLYYVNPDISATKAFIGLKEENDEFGASSSLIMGTYQQEIVTSTFSKSMQDNIGIINRYALAMNPLSSVGSEMLMKFDIN
jgi:hypothetical protein